MTWEVNLIFNIKQEQMYKHVVNIAKLTLWNINSHGNSLAE